MRFNNDTDLYRVIGSNIKHYRENCPYFFDVLPLEALGL